MRDNGTSGQSFEQNRDTDTQEAYPTLGDFDIPGDAYELDNPKDGKDVEVPEPSSLMLLLGLLAGLVVKRRR